MTRWSTAVLVCLVACPAAAQADPPPPDAADEAFTGARAALAEAQPGRAFELARLARAFDPSRSVEAWELMGRAASEMGRFEAAHRFFRRALAFADAAERHRLLARIQLARDELGLVRVQVEPAGAQLFVDGEGAEYETGGVLLLRPGTRRLEARLEGHEPRFQIVQVSPGSERAVHLILHPGVSETPRRAPRPRAQPQIERWLTGNATLIGLGGLGLAAAGSADTNAPGLGGSMSLQLGLSFGLVLGSGLNLALQAAFDPEANGSLLLVRFLTVPVLAAAAMAVGATEWFGPVSCGPNADEPCPVDPESARATGTVVGTLVGVGVATMANAGLGSRDTPIAFSLGIAFSALTIVELGFTVEAATSAGAMRAEAEGQTGGQAIATLEAAAARESLAQITGGLAAGFGALAISSLVLGLEGERDALDLRIAVGPGTLSLSGTF